MADIEVPRLHQNRVLRCIIYVMIVAGAHEKNDDEEFVYVAGKHIENRVRELTGEAVFHHWGTAAELGLVLQKPATNKDGTINPDRPGPDMWRLTGEASKLVSLVKKDGWEVTKKATKIDPTGVDNKKRDTVEFTEREHQVLVHISNGLQDTEIAKELKISVATVRKQTQSIQKKLKVNNRNKIIIWAARNLEQA